MTNREPQGIEPQGTPLGERALPVAATGSPRQLGPQEASAVEAEGLVAGYDGTTVVHGVSLTALPGRVTTLLGPNGCGKSTLLKAMSRVIPAAHGSVRVGGQSIHGMAPRAAARLVSLLPQQPSCPDGLTVGELVSRGRHPHTGMFSRESSADRAAIGRALEVTRTAGLVERPVNQLSGGQRQRVWMAMVLAQDTPVVLLDEPTTFLDPAHALEILELARGLADAGRTVVMVLHDLTSAAAVSDHIVVLKEGRVYAEGNPQETITPEVLAAVYNLQADVWADPTGGGPVVVPRAVVRGGDAT